MFTLNPFHLTELLAVHVFQFLGCIFQTILYLVNNVLLLPFPISISHLLSPREHCCRTEVVADILDLLQTLMRIQRNNHMNSSAVQLITASHPVFHPSYFINLTTPHFYPTQTFYPTYSTLEGCYCAPIFHHSKP